MKNTLEDRREGLGIIETVMYKIKSEMFNLKPLKKKINKSKKISPKINKNKLLSLRQNNKKHRMSSKTLKIK